MDRNERKRLILQAIRDLGPSTAVDVWEALEDDVSLNGVGMSLLSYIRIGLLKRSGSPKTYELTAKGEARLNLLTVNEIRRLRRFEQLFEINS